MGAFGEFRARGQFTSTQGQDQGKGWPLKRSKRARLAD